MAMRTLVGFTSMARVATFMTGQRRGATPCRRLLRSGDRWRSAQKRTRLFCLVELRDSDP
jgi:hypothetical protein